MWDSGIIYHLLIVILQTHTTVIAPNMIWTRTTVVVPTTKRHPQCQPRCRHVYHSSRANQSTDCQINLCDIDSVHNACNPESLNDSSSSTDDRVNSGTIDWLQVLEVDPALILPRRQSHGLLLTVVQCFETIPMYIPASMIRVNTFTHRHSLRSGGCHHVSDRHICICHIYCAPCTDHKL